MDRAAPETQGFSPERLARIGAVMARHVEEGRLPGVATLIARRGRIVHLETVGWADVAARRGLAPDTILRIYSMTKPITVAVALLLGRKVASGSTTRSARTCPNWRACRSCAAWSAASRCSLRPAGR